MALIGPLTPYNLLENQALTVSGGDTPSATSNPLPTGMLSKLHVYVSNAGASTSVTVDIYGKKTATTNVKEHLATFTLGAATGSGANLVPYSAGRYIESSAIPSFIYAVATNSDTANAANVSCTIDRWR